MEQLLALDSEKDNRIREKLGKTLFSDPEQFISYYNSGIINKKFKDIDTIAKDIVDTYRNVKLKNKDLSFISKEEVFATEIMSSVEQWLDVSRFKRELMRLLSNETLTQEDTIVYRSNGTFCTSENENDMSQEKIFKNFDEAVSVFRKFSSFRDRDVTDAVFFKVYDIMNIDTGFLERMFEILPR